MNEELIENRLSTIEGKLDKLAQLMEQTHLQEYRIAALEDANGKLMDKLSALDSRINMLEHKSGNLAMKVLAYIATGIGSILLGFIALRVGLK